MQRRTSVKTKEDIWHRSQTRRIKHTCWIELAQLRYGSERPTEREKNLGSGLTAIWSISRAGLPESPARRTRRTVLSSTGLNTISKDGTTLAVTHHLTLSARQQFAQVLFELYNICKSSLCSGSTRIAPSSYGSKCEGSCVVSCPPGWEEREGGHCYFWSQEKLFWGAAEEKCRSMDGHLASVTSQDVHDYLHLNVRTNNGSVSYVS